MTRPTIPDERAPYSTDSRLSGYLTKMFRACKLCVDNLFKWTVTHVAIDAPDYDNDPHEQYWHVVNDSAAAHIFYQDYVTGKSLTDGSIITGWDSDAYTPYKAQSDLLAGTITTPDTEGGVYHFAVGVTIGDMQSNTTYMFIAYADGQQTSMVLPIVASGNITSGYNTFSGSVALGPNVTLDIRCTGGSCTLAQANFSLTRYLNTSEFDTGIQSIGFETPGPIDPDWGQNP